MKQILFTIYVIFFALPSWGSDIQNAINEFFPIKIEVYGVKIIGTEATPRKDIKRLQKYLNNGWIIMVITNQITV